jgi:hypothetical protein
VQKSPVQAAALLVIDIFQTGWQPELGLFQEAGKTPVLA